MYSASMDDVLGALEAETESLSAFLDGLSADQWQHPSACTGWSVSDVVLHLAQSEEGVIGAFDRGNAGILMARYAGEATSGEGGVVDGIVEAAVRAERPEDPAEVLGRWRRANSEVIKRFRESEPGLRLNWISAPLSARTLATTRLSEHWIHSMDIREPLGDPAPDTDRLWLIARLAWRTIPYAFNQAGGTVPRVALDLTGPSGEEWCFGESACEVTISGLAGEWCRVAARRLSPEQTSLVASGPNSKRVLELVRTYA